MTAADWLTLFMARRSFAVMYVVSTVSILASVFCFRLPTTMRNASR